MIKLLAVLAAGGALLYRFANHHVPSHIRHDKRLREDLSENQIDGMVESSFPASDPPSTY